MEFMRKYWPMLIMAFGLMSSALAAQIQVTTNATDIKEIKEDIKNMDGQRTEQAIIKNNQKHMRESLKEIKQLLQEIKK